MCAANMGMGTSARMYREMMAHMDREPTYPVSSIRPLIHSPAYALTHCHDQFQFSGISNSYTRDEKERRRVEPSRSLSSFEIIPFRLSAIPAKGTPCMCAVSLSCFTQPSFSSSLLHLYINNQPSQSRTYSPPNSITNARLPSSIGKESQYTMGIIVPGIP